MSMERSELMTLSQEDLDDLVVGVFEAEAAAVNNRGRERQIDLLLHGEIVVADQRTGKAFP